LQKLKKHCHRLLISVPYNEYPGKYLHHHKLHNLTEANFPGFAYTFLNDEEIANKPDASKHINLLLMDYGKTKEVKNKIKYSIVIPSYQHLDDLLKPCVESIIKYTNLANIEVIIVANGCDIRTKEYVNSLGSNFKLIWSEQQLGYVKATNLGIKAACGEYVILLNNDTCVLDTNWIELLQMGFRNDKVGVTGPNKAYNELVKSEYMLFFCVMIAKKVFDAIGYLDENFGIGYHEDVDFCVRTIKAGFSLVEVPENINYDENNKGNAERIGNFPIYHAGGGTFRHIYGDSDERLTKHVKYLQDKHSMTKFDKIMLQKCIDDALAGRSNINQEILRIDGMSSPTFRHLLNNVCKGQSINYLECGAWKGSTVCSALSNNKNTQAFIIENFSQFVDKELVPTPDVHPKKLLHSNLEQYATKNYKIIEEDFYNFDVKSLPKIDVFFYDGGMDLTITIKLFSMLCRV
jgi:GT2 family glycosyltransferase